MVQYIQPGCVSGVWIQSPVEPSFNVPGGWGGGRGEEICDDPKVYKSLICLKREVIVQFKNSSSS